MSTEEETATLGSTLYHQGMKEEEVAEIFDDAALIEAYERSVAQAYKASSNSKSSKAPSNSKAKVKAKFDSGPKWNVGDQCLAPYDEDGLLYQATVVGLSTDDVYATIHFDDYEDDQEQKTRLTLLQPLTSSHQLHVYDEEEFQAPQYSTQPLPSLIGDKFPAGTGRNIPTLPPPPPPSWLAGGSNNGTLPTEEDALSSALLSWYLSGYHTGYYQALKDAKSNK